jgi:hypothetical protein
MENKNSTSEPAVNEEIAKKADEIKVSEPTEIKTEQPIVPAEPVIEDDEALLGKKNKSENYSPMETQRIDRKYSSEITGETVDRVSPEENVSSSSSAEGASQTTVSNSKGSNGAGASEPVKSEVQNAQMAQLTPEEQKLASTMLVDGLLGIYRQLNDLGAWAVKVPDDQITEWILDEKISEDITVPYGTENKRVSIREYYQEFNKSVEEAGAIPPDHFDSVRESMIREFVRRGWGITDMQNIIQFFARDFVMRTSNFYVLKRQNSLNTKLMFKMWENQKELLKKQGNNSHSDDGDAGTSEASA